MSDKSLLEDGRYLANVKSIDFKTTSDGVVFIEVSLYVSICLLPLDNIVLNYRLPLTSGSFKKTFSQLSIMGAKMNENIEGEIENPLDGVGEKEFYANCVSLECHENEAPGKYRTYVKSVESL